MAPTGVDPVTSRFAGEGVMQGFRCSDAARHPFSSRLDAFGLCSSVPDKVGSDRALPVSRAESAPLVR